MNKYLVTKQSGMTEEINATCFEFDWKSKDLSNSKIPMNVIFYSDEKKYLPIAYLSRIINVEEIK